MKVAFMTIGILYEPFGRPRSQGFVDRIPSVFAAADSSHGFVDRSKPSPDNSGWTWGELQLPECYDEIGDALRLPSTLSLWDDLESVAAFAYHGPHGEAMKTRREWFQPNELPEHVAWWMEDPEGIDPADAKSRMDHLNKNGSTPFAFTLNKPFDSSGETYKLDPERVKMKVMVNGGATRS